MANQRQSWLHSPWIWDVLRFDKEYDLVLLLLEHVNVSWLSVCSDCKNESENEVQIYIPNLSSVTMNSENE